jgi:hypothetical protein
MGDRKLPGRGIDRRSLLARSIFDSEQGGDDLMGVELDESVPVPRSRPLGRMASRRNLSAVVKRPSVMARPSAASAGGTPLPQRGIAATSSGDSQLSSAAASIASSRANSVVAAATPQRLSDGSSAPGVLLPAAPPRNAEENWLRQSMMRSSHSTSSAAAVAAASPAAAAATHPAHFGGFDMNAIQAAMKEDEAMEAAEAAAAAAAVAAVASAPSASGFDDEEVLEQYRIMAQHEATLRVKANIGFDMDDYEKRRKTSDANTKDQKEMFGGGQRPNLPLLPPQPVGSGISGANNITNCNGNNNHHDHHPQQQHMVFSQPPLWSEKTLHHINATSRCYQLFFQEQQRQQASLPELSRGEKVHFTQSAEGDHVVRCWGCRQNLKVNFVATLVQCPDCMTVSQARNKKN